MASRRPTPGSPESLTSELLAQHGWIRRLAQRLLGAGREVDVDADDVTQSVMTAALEARPSPREGSGLRAWLATVTRRQARQCRLRRWRRTEVEGRVAPGDETPVDADPASVVARLHLHQELTGYVLGLPDPYRAVIVARFLDERSVAAIAAERGVPTPTIRQQLSRGLDLVRERMQREHGREWRSDLAVLCGLGHSTLGTPTAVLLAASTMKLVLCLAGTAMAILFLVWCAMPTAPLPAPRASGGTAAVAVTSADAPIPGDGQTRARSRAALVPGTAAAPVVSVAVRDFHGRPVTGAMAVLVPDHRPAGMSEVHMATTDAEGKADLGTVEDGVAGWHLLVIADGCPSAWTRFAVPSEGGLVPFLIGGPGRIGGLVRIAAGGDPEGKASDALPGHLIVRSGGEEPLYDLPEGLKRRLLELGYDLALQAKARVDAGTGRFDFFGLPADLAQVRVELPWHEPFVVSGTATSSDRTDPGGAAFPVGTVDAILGIVPVPAVRGRVLFDDGRPAAAAEVNFQGVLVERQGPGSSVLTQPDGSFCIGLAFDSIPHHRWLDVAHQPRVARMRFFSVTHPEAMPSSAFQFEFPANTRWADAGEIVLRRLCPLHIRTVDRTGAPVFGAVAAGTNLSEPSDREGLTTVGVATGTVRRLRIGAPGFLVDEYEAATGSGAAEDPLRFVLAAENRIRLHLAPGHLAPSDVHLQIDAEKDLFHGQGEGSTVMPSRLHRSSGTSRVSSAGNPKVGNHSLRSADFEADGTFSLTSVNPGRSLDVTLLDHAGQTLVATSVTTPPFGESTEVELVPQVSLCRIEGHVRTAAGMAVNGAHVEIGEERNVNQHIYKTRCRTDRDGSFTANLAASGEEVPVMVTAEGLLLQRGSCRLTAGTVTLEFALDDGCEILVHVVDASGTRVDTEVAVGDTSIGARVNRAEDGGTRICGLPARTVELTTRYAGRVFRQSVDPSRKHEVSMALPTALTIPLRVAAFVRPETVLSLGIRAVDGGASIGESLHCVDGEWQPATIRIYPGTYDVRCQGLGSPEDWTTRWTVADGDASVRWLMK
ncbi:MAG: sigma-70 family RNA polymerase sigma factor [Planctomycetota bacterium]